MNLLRTTPGDVANFESSCNPLQGKYELHLIFHCSQLPETHHRHQDCLDFLKACQLALLMSQQSLMEEPLAPNVTTPISFAKRTLHDMKFPIEPKRQPD